MEFVDVPSSRFGSARFSSQHAHAHPSSHGTFPVALRQWISAFVVGSVRDSSSPQKEVRATSRLIKLDRLCKADICPHTSLIPHPCSASPFSSAPPATVHDHYTTVVLIRTPICHSRPSTLNSTVVPVLRESPGSPRIPTATSHYSSCNRLRSCRLRRSTTSSSTPLQPAVR